MTGKNGVEVLLGLSSRGLRSLLEFGGPRVCWGHAKPGH